MPDARRIWPQSYITLLLRPRLTSPLPSDVSRAIRNLQDSPLPHRSALLAPLQASCCRPDTLHFVWSQHSSRWPPPNRHHHSSLYQGQIFHRLYVKSCVPLSKAPCIPGALQSTSWTATLNLVAQMLVTDLRSVPKRSMAR